MVFLNVYQVVWNVLTSGFWTTVGHWDVQPPQSHPRRATSPITHAKSDVNPATHKSPGSCSISVLTPGPNYWCKWLITWIMLQGWMEVFCLSLETGSAELVHRKTDTQPSLRDGRLGSEHLQIGPKAFPISRHSTGHSTRTGVGGYLWPFCST